MITSLVQSVVISSEFNTKPRASLHSVCLYAILELSRLYIELSRLYIKLSRLFIFELSKLSASSSYKLPRLQTRWGSFYYLAELNKASVRRRQPQQCQTSNCALMGSNGERKVGIGQ